MPHDHLVRSIADVLDLSWVRAELAPHYSALGRPSIDRVLMIRMLVVGYVFAIRSERALCREVQVNLAYRWFCGLGIEDKVRITRCSRGAQPRDQLTIVSGEGCWTKGQWRADRRGVIVT